MTIVIFNKLLKIRILIKNVLAIYEDTSKIFSISNTKNIEKLSSIRKIDMIFIDEETAFCNLDFLVQFFNKVSNPVHIIILHFNKVINKKEFLLSSKNSTLVYIDPNLDFTNEHYVSVLTNKLKPII